MGGAAYEPELDLPGSRQPRRQRPPYTRRPTQHPCWAAQSRRDRISRVLQVSIIHGAQKYPRGHPSGSIGTHTHPHVRLGTHGQLPYLPRPLNLVGHDRSMPACYGTMHWPVVQSRQYGYSVCGIASTPSVIMAQLQTFNGDQFSAG